MTEPDTQKAPRRQNGEPQTISAPWWAMDARATPGTAGLLPALSVVTPMCNEAGGAAQHVREIAKILKNELGDVTAEIIVIDDGSTDGTIEELLAERAAGTAFRLLTHGTNAGQSRAIRTGVLAAHHPVIAMIDGDGQNPPGDIPAVYRQLVADTAKSASKESPLAMVAGERQARQDTGARRFASKIANDVREAILRDGARDSGCGLKLFWREAFLRLPFFDHLHRYLPFMMQREGFRVEFANVTHRARGHGQSKYTNWGRLGVAFRDLLGVTWLRARLRHPGTITER